MALRLALLAVLALTACATGHPTPDAIFRHPATGDVQWCDKGSVAATVVLGAAMGVAQGADYAGCKTQWENKGYVSSITRQSLDRMISAVMRRS